ncbi:hypothetical protein LZ24_02232 [Desulfobotulus alkaliphilus]|uniref:Uncharacterized protein n=1 Tax=Desulfobotulus alkaliphilus TaxID=622671 RepID=A0A562RNP9_9BACT|nr:hypothetical protein [Desulfobotulus alkaliphilus]TWI70662.1 hypothetical protein LZ24_02232 [Desulfobotulus alkaliphilus]
MYRSETGSPERTKGMKTEEGGSISEKSCDIYTDPEELRLIERALSGISQ